MGVATTNGAQALLDAFPYKDSTQVAQLKAAGALILGEPRA